ncbi:MAG: glutamate--tRNA ligase [Bacteroidetes bacterium CG2_30_32_10]|nr:MAG: glutamate--tRNA ligase [Bacteroidetes bacterium CG2_30_32_10]
MTKNIRVRFAPSPTGPLHIGGVRTALYNYLFAKKNNGDFILRIEDTDQTRFVTGAEEYIIESLEWCGLKFDEGVHISGPHAPYRQSERKELYKEYADLLLAKGFAYYAFDSSEELETLRKEYESKKETFFYSSKTRLNLNNSLTISESEVKQKLLSGEKYVIRIKIPENEQIVVNDQIRGVVTFDSSLLDDKVLYKSDGMPTYHLANVVDDHLMEITHVIRGEEWLPSAPLHVLLYRYLGWEKEMPQFAHLPLLLKPDGNGKLSKRDGDRLGFPVFPLQWIDPKTKEIYSGYKESGYFPEAFINMLALLGWNPGTEQEIFNLQQLIEAFTIDRVGKSGSKFDPEKAKWFNHQYIQKKDNKTLAYLFAPVLIEKNISADIKYVEEVCGLMKERINFMSEMWDKSAFFFTAPSVYDPKLIKDKWKENSAQILTLFSENIVNLQNHNIDSIDAFINEFLTTNQLGKGQLMPLLRLCLVGNSTGPDITQIISFIGKTESINRINNCIQKVK